MIWSTIISRGIQYSALWWILADGNLTSWWIGVPAVLFAVITSVILFPPATNLRWFEILKFIPFFLFRSLLGGIDVARRAFHPNLPIAPNLIEYPLLLPPGLPQVLMINIASLLPGTLITELNQSVLRVHVLDSQKDFLTELISVEQRVARIFGISLDTSLK